MTQRKRLQKLRVSFECRLNRLKKKVQPFLVSRISSDREAVVTYAAIECLNAWSNFVRAYYLSCAIGTTTESGDKVTPSIPILTCTDAIGIAITVFRPYASATASGRWLRRDEPTWHDPNTLLRLSARLGFSNLADIQAGMSAGFRVFADLPCVGISSPTGTSILEGQQDVWLSFTPFQDLRVHRRCCAPIHTGGPKR